MLRLPSIDLDANHQGQLDKWQEEINLLASYSLRVSEASARFKARNKASNPTFAHVRHRLNDMCHGCRRCAYCEDSVADEVEHIRPKDLFPEEVFSWDNYLYACGPCNGPKNSKFSILDNGHQLVDITRRRNSPVIPPLQGEQALLDPRSEDPMDYLELDIGNTLLFLPRIGLPDKDYRRAEHTIDILRLNSRDYLVESRRSALGAYLARLFEYVTCKQLDEANTQLTRLELGIRSAHHRTVWKEMQRQRYDFDKLTYLFDSAPEAMTW